MSYLRYLCLLGSSLSPVVCRRAHVLFKLFVLVWFVVTFSCLFGSSLSPVVCRRAHVLFTLCLVRLCLQLFVGGLMSYLRFLCL